MTESDEARSDGERGHDPRGDALVDAAVLPDGAVLAVHFGRSASCSSIGSFVDFLFVSSVVGSAVIAAVAVMIRESEPSREPEPTRRTDEREREE